MCYNTALCHCSVSAIVLQVCWQHQCDVGHTWPGPQAVPHEVAALVGGRLPVSARH